MPLAEAFLRESMRYTPFFTRGQEHKVTSPGGITLPNGVSLPNGTLLGCPMARIARGERFYASSDKFDPFRFLCEAVDEHGARKWTLRPNCQLTSPSVTFLGFGYGRHAW